MDQTRSGPWRLYSGQRSVFANTKTFQSPLSAKNRYVCQPRKYPTQTLHCKVPSLAGFRRRFFEVHSGKSGGLLCQSPMEGDLPMVETSQNASPGQVLGGFTSMGWCSMVAPTSKTARTWYPSVANPSSPRIVSELLVTAHAKANVGPDLAVFLRMVLESQEVQAEAINLFL